MTDDVGLRLAKRKEALQSARIESATLQGAAISNVEFAP